jgi:hypothetical protein
MAMNHKFHKLIVHTAQVYGGRDNTRPKVDNRHKKTSVGCVSEKRWEPTEVSSWGVEGDGSYAR